MKPNKIKPEIAALSAFIMILAGIALSVWGFIVPPLGEISDSVLWFLAQALLYAGSIFGVSVYVQNKFNEFRANFIEKGA